MNELEHDITMALDKLTAEGCAENIRIALAGLGYQGFVGSASSCPIAQYLKGEVRALKDCHLSVGPLGVVVTEFEFNGMELVATTVSADVAPSTLIGEFITQFDDGAYPELFKRLESRRD